MNTIFPPCSNSWTTSTSFARQQNNRSTLFASAFKSSTSGPFGQMKMVLFKVGDHGSLFYIILRGSVGINICLPNTEEPDKFDVKEVNILKAGSSFGELALINDAKRTATVIAKEDCIFAVMEKYQYKAILGANELAKIQGKIVFLCSFPFFQTWSYREIKTISYHFEPVRVQLNQPVIRQGEPCNHFYVVNEGEFEVQHHFSKAIIPDCQIAHLPLMTRSICMLGPGEFFGEEAFYLVEEGRFAIKPTHPNQQWGSNICSVICRSQVGIVYKITREDIQKRFWESKTQGIFVQLLTLIHNFREENIKKQKKLIEERIQQSIVDDIGQFRTPKPQMQVRRINQLTHRKSETERIDWDYQSLKKQESQAIEQFKKLFKDRNCSYAQVRTFFDQKTIQSQEYIAKASYLRQFFRFHTKNPLTVGKSSKSSLAKLQTEPSINKGANCASSLQLRLTKRLFQKPMDLEELDFVVRTQSPPSNMVTRTSMNSFRVKTKA